MDIATIINGGGSALCGYLGNNPASGAVSKGWLLNCMSYFDRRLSDYANENSSGVRFKDIPAEILENIIQKSQGYIVELKGRGKAATLGKWTTENVTYNWGESSDLHDVNPSNSQLSTSGQQYKNMNAEVPVRCYLSKAVAVGYYSNAYLTDVI